jgi:ribosomal protein S18 acetylase RimI-like enzyme
MNIKVEDISIVRAEKNHAVDCADSVGGSAIGQRYFADRKYARRLIRSGIDKKEIFVGIDGRGAVAGFYWSSPAGMFCRFPYLRILAVKPRFRGLGVGKRLLEHFEENGFKKASRVFLAVSDFNAGAQRFYKRNGYVRVGTLPDLYKQGIAEILMVKSSA